MCYGKLIKVRKLPETGCYLVTEPLTVSDT